MQEPAVTLTDYFLTLEAGLFATFLWRLGHRLNTLAGRFALFFGSVSAASFLGGTVHGFFLDERSLGCAILWPATLLATGVTSFAAWAIGAALICPPRIGRLVTAAAFAQLACYSAVVLFVSQEFWVAIVASLPAILFLLIALILRYRKGRLPTVLRGACGAAVILLGGLMQHLRIGIHPEHFNHNAVYHVVQAIGLVQLFRGGQALAASSHSARGV